MKFSIEQLIYADDLCWGDTAKNLFKKHFGDEWITHHANFTGFNNTKCSFVQWIFTTNSRSGNLANNREVGNIIDAMLVDLIGDYDPSK